MFCFNCGKEVPDEYVMCPKCNAMLLYRLQKRNDMAWVGFICSFLMPLLGFIFALIGLSKANKTGEGMGVAIAGIIISAIQLIIHIILGVWLTVFIMAFMEEYTALLA